MKFLVFVSLALVSFSGFAQGGEGANGGGGPSITLRYNNIEVRVPTGFDEVKSDYSKWELPKEDFPRLDLKTYDGLERSCSVLIFMGESSDRCGKKVQIKELKSPVDLEIEGAGVIDLQTFKDETPKALWREENDKIIIDSRVPVINWQDLDGEFHELK